MKVLLNLLPEEGRVLIRRAYYARAFFWQSLVLFSIMIFYLLMLTGVFFIVREDRILSAQAEADRAKSQVELRELESYEAKFREANRLSAQANAFDREHIYWTELMARLDRIVPQNIMITNLTTKNYQIFIAGLAKNRDDFLELEKRLKEDSCFTDFQAPVNNLFSEKNVIFQIDFSIKSECIQSRTLL